MSDWTDFFMDTYPNSGLQRHQVEALFKQFNGEYDLVVEYYETHLRQAMQTTGPNTKPNTAQVKQDSGRRIGPIQGPDLIPKKKSLSQVEYDYVDRDKKRELGAFGYLRHNTNLKEKEKTFLSRQAKLLTLSAVDLLREGFSLDEVKQRFNSKKNIKEGSILDHQGGISILEIFVSEKELEFIKMVF